MAAALALASAAGSQIFLSVRRTPVSGSCGLSQGAGPSQGMLRGRRTLDGHACGLVGFAAAAAAAAFALLRLRGHCCRKVARDWFSSCC